jgi:hypothetical protein
MCDLEAESLAHHGAPAGAEPLAQALCHEQGALLVVALRGRLRTKKNLRKFRKYCPVPEIIDTVFAKTSPKRSFSSTEYDRFGLVFTKTRDYKFGHWT